MGYYRTTRKKGDTLVALGIDWDNYEVIEAEDYTLSELSDTIEDVRETLDLLGEAAPEGMLELLTELSALEDWEETHEDLS